MRAMIVLFVILTGCSTTQSLQAKAPVFQQTTGASLAQVQGCIAQRTANQNVQYLPRPAGATFSGGVITGAARYVTWVADLDDLQSDRRVTVYATRANSKLILPAITACMG